MFKKTLAKILISMAALLIIVSLSPVQAAEKEKPVLLKVPVCFPTVLPGMGSPALWMQERMEVASGGSIKMKVYEPGKLVAAFEILDAVSTGKVNAGNGTAGFWAGKIPASPLFSSVPFGPEAGEYLAWLYYGNGMKLYQEMYDQAGYNVKVFVCSITAPETSGWFTKPITSPDQLKGLRMRFFGLGATAMENLGVSTSLLPGGEIFPALEKGAIDATEFSMPAIDKRIGLYKIAKYNYYPGWHQQATTYELLINKDVWNGMSAHQQMVVEMVTKASTLDAFALTEAIQADVMKENVEKHGVHNMYWSPEMLATFKGAWDTVAKEQADADPFFKKVWDDMSAFRDSYKLWQTYAFLPRPAVPESK